MEQPTAAPKLKKWGMWAVIGLAAILVIAGLIIAITSLLGPKPTEDVASEDTSTQEEPPKEEEQETPTKEETPEETEKPVTELPIIIATPEADLPKTGPEDTIAPILATGAASYLVALYINTLRRRN